MSDVLLDRELGMLVDEHEQYLRDRHPQLTAYLESVIIARHIGFGAFEVVGEIYPDRESAYEARRALIMHRLTAMESLARSVERKAHESR